MILCSYYESYRVVWGMEGIDVPIMEGRRSCEGWNDVMFLSWEVQSHVIHGKT